MYRLFSVIYFLLFVTAAACAQDKPYLPLKDLTMLVQKSNPDTNRLQLLLQLSAFYQKKTTQNRTGTDSAFLYLQQAMKLADSLPNEKWRHESWRYAGNYYFTKGDHKQGKAYFIKIINEVNKTGNKDEEIKWWSQLENNINYADSTGITKIDCFKKTALLYDQLNKREDVILSRLQIAKVYVYQGKLNLAENEIEKILEIYKPAGTHSLHYAYYLLATIHRYKGNFNKALWYAMECVKDVEKTGDTVTVDYYYGELALVYEELGQTEKSIEWYRKTLDAREKTHSEIYIIYRTAGFLIQQLLKQKREKEAFDIITGIEKETPPFTPYQKSILAQVKANYYNGIHQYELAEKYYLEMIEGNGFKDENKEIVSIAYQDIGKFYLEQKKYSKANEYISRSLEMDKGDATLSRLKDIHLMLFKVDSSTGNYLSAINHLSQLQQIKDSIFSEDKSKQIEELQIQYETEKKEQDIKLLEKEGTLQQGRLSQAKVTRNWTLGAFVLLVIITGLLVNYLRLKQRTNKKLEGQQKEINQKKDSLQHLLNEKEWLLKEIHHRVKNNLHTIVGLLDTQAGFLKTEEGLSALNDSQHRVQAMSLIHQKLYQSPDLSAIEMSGYVHELVDYLEHAFGTKKRILFKLEIENLQLHLSHALPLGLILNEAITNAIKYAFPGNKDGVVTIWLKHREQNYYLLTIADNGKGLPGDLDYKKSSSMGMNLMQGLTEDMHGTFSIKNKGGAEISISFKYDPPSGNDLTFNKADHSIENN